VRAAVAGNYSHRNDRRARHQPSAAWYIAVSLSVDLCKFALLFSTLYAAFGVASPFLPELLSLHSADPERLGLTLSLATIIRLRYLRASVRFLRAGNARHIGHQHRRARGCAFRAAQSRGNEHLSRVKTGTTLALLPGDGGGDQSPRSGLTFRSPEKRDGSRPTNFARLRTRARRAKVRGIEGRTKMSERQLERAALGETIRGVAGATRLA
jgi:hypothetical protein